MAQERLKMNETGFYSIEASADVAAAMTRLGGSRTRPLFVLDGGTLKGVFTEADARAHLLRGGKMTDAVGPLAEETAFVCQDRPGDAQKIFAECGLPVLPVVDECRRLVGIVRADDGIEIRELTGGDLSAIFDFYDNLGGEGRAFFNHGDCNRIDLLRWLTEPEKDSVHFGAFDGQGKMIGHLLLIRLDTATPWLGIALRGDCRGKGLGERLLGFADDYALSRGCGGIFLTTSIANIRGQGLYQKMGYVRQGIHTGGEILYFKAYRRKDAGAERG